MEAVAAAREHSINIVARPTLGADGAAVEFVGERFFQIPALEARLGFGAEAPSQLGDRQMARVFVNLGAHLPDALDRLREGSRRLRPQRAREADVSLAVSELWFY